MTDVSPRRRALIAALAGLAGDAAWALNCGYRTPPHQAWPLELVAEAAAVFTGRVIELEGDPRERQVFAIGQVQVERAFKGDAGAQVRLVLPSHLQPGQRLLFFAHVLSLTERQRLVTRRLDLQRFIHVECDLYVEGRCSQGLDRPEIDFPPLSAVELRACHDRPVMELVPVARHRGERSESDALALLQAALR